MDTPVLSRRMWLAGAACLGLGACGQAPGSDTAQDTRERLVGTWLRDYEEGQVRVRRVLVLDASGQFHEASRITEQGAAEIDHTGEGDWLFDGTNLKRRYTRVDGKAPSAPIVPFATFELRFPSRNQFIGLDRVRHVEVSYRRVEDGTEP
jgi:hypothetical protein